MTLTIWSHRDGAAVCSKLKTQKQTTTEPWEAAWRGRAASVHGDGRDFHTFDSFRLQSQINKVLGMSVLFMVKYLPSLSPARREDCPHSTSVIPKVSCNLDVKNLWTELRVFTEKAKKLNDKLHDFIPVRPT